VLLNSIEQTRDTVTLYSSAFEQISENHINLTVRTDDINSVTLDGNLVTGFSEVVANPDYSVASVQVFAGSHTLIASGCGLIATATGYGELESYAYSAGASFKNINVNPIPVGGCLNDTLQFDTGLPEGRGLAIWDFGDGTGSAELAPTHIYTELGTYQVTLLVTDLCLGTEDTLVQDLEVSLRQQVEARGDTLVCEGAEVSLFASDLPEASYTWIGPNGYFSEEQFPIIPNIPAANSGTYDVVGTISGCSTYPNAALVAVNPTPAPDLGEDTTICGDKTFLLEPGDFAAYRWQNGSGASTFLVTDPGEFEVEVQDELGCSGTDEMQVLEYCPPVLFVPTAFSPNQDGFNDQMTYRASYMTRFQFQVFSRWGQIIFATNDPEAYWDGNTPGQGKAPEGVYVWKANYDYQGLDGFTYVQRQSGTVTLIR
ncbi:MAG: gliding motility-associated C-terminal domain-containing protein, partial [Bacteroidota bacterium]